MQALTTHQNPAVRYMRGQIDLWISRVQQYQRGLNQLQGDKRQAFFDEMVRLRAKIAQMQEQLSQSEE